MTLATPVAIVIYSLFFLASCASDTPRGMKEAGESGVFQITRMSPRSAQFIFGVRDVGFSRPRREVVDVIARPNEDIRRAVARRMVETTRQYKTGDFNWESYRLGRVVILSNRMEDSKGLEDFFIREFFINYQLVQVDPEQVNDLRERGIKGNVIAEGVFTSEGTVRELVIVESPHPALEKVVIEAILKYRFDPLQTQPGETEPARYRQSFNFAAGIDGRSTQHDFPKKTDHLPIEFQYDSPPIIKVVAPVVYPFNLLQSDISGSAKVAVIVDPDGNVREVQILEATHPEFGFATRGMLESWKFEPATKEGKQTWAIFTLE
jgi:TonB family protein